MIATPTPRFKADPPAPRKGTRKTTPNKIRTTRLDADTVRAIFQLDASESDIARRYGATISQVSAIRTGKNYRAITEGLTPGKRKQAATRPRIIDTRAKMAEYVARSNAKRADQLDTPEMRNDIAVLGTSRAARLHNTSSNVTTIILDRMVAEVALPPNENGVEWRWAPGFSQRIAVSNMGDIRVVRRTSTHGCLSGVLAPAELHLSGDKRRQYHTISWRGRFLKVHHLVLHTFVGLRPTRYHFACHFDDDPLNNKLSNLRWDTARNNNVDRYRNRGPDCGLSFEQIREIYQADGFTAKELGARYGVDKSIIGSIRQRRSWAEVTAGLTAGRNAGYGAIAGERHYAARMTADMVRTARRQAAAGRGITEIARELGLNPVTLRSAVVGTHWAHVTDVPPVTLGRTADLCRLPSLNPDAAEKGEVYPFDMVTGARVNAPDNSVGSQRAALPAAREP